MCRLTALPWSYLQGLRLVFYIDPYLPFQRPSTSLHFLCRYRVASTILAAKQLCTYAKALRSRNVLASVVLIIKSHVGPLVRLSSSYQPEAPTCRPPASS